MNKVLVCQDCGSEFIFTENDQKFYEEKGFKEPKRCRACRPARRERFADKNEK